MKHCKNCGVTLFRKERSLWLCRECWRIAIIGALASVVIQALAHLVGVL